MQLDKFFMHARVRLLVLGTLGLNKEEHDEQNPDRRGGRGGVCTDVRILETFCPGRPELAVPRLPLTPPQLTQLGSV